MADSKNNNQDANDFVLRRIGIAFAVLMLALAVAVIAELFDGKSEDFRNWMLGIAPIGAGIFWYLRNQVLKQQADASDRQAAAGDRQAETDRLRLTDERLSDAAKAKADQIRLADERFSDAVKLLSQNDENGKPTIAARLGGIFVLEKLANSLVLEYGAQVIKTLVAYIKENIQLTAKPLLAENKKMKEARPMGEDVKTAFDILDKLLGAHKLEAIEQFGLSIDNFDFCGHDFSWLHLFRVRSIDFRNCMLLGIDMQSADLLGSDLRGANLSYAKLQKTMLRETKLQGVMLERAKLQGADLSGAKLLYADFSTAELDADTKLSSECSGEIWHSGQAEFKKRNIESRSWGAVWDLEPFLDSADSLVGILHIYADCRIFLSGTENQKMRARKLRQAARKLQKDGEIPEGFPQNWRNWLSEIKEDGSHLGDPHFA